MFKGYLKPKNKICEGTGVNEGLGCGGLCRTQYNGLCYVCKNKQKHENTYTFAAVSPETIEKLKKIIGQIPDGYKKIAYKLYLKETGASGFDVRPLEFYKQNDGLDLKHYRERVFRALDYNLNPKGTKHTPSIVTIVFGQVSGKKLKKQMWDKSIARIETKDVKTDYKVQRAFRALDNFSNSLQTRQIIDKETDEDM